MCTADHDMDGCRDLDIFFEEAFMADPKFVEAYGDLYREKK